MRINVISATALLALATSFPAHAGPSTDFSTTGVITGAQSTPLIVTPDSVPGGNPDTNFGALNIVFGTGYNTPAYRALYSTGNLNTIYDPSSVAAPATFINAASVPAGNYQNRTYSIFNLTVRGAGTYTFQVFDPAFDANYVRTSPASPTTIDLMASLYAASGSVGTAFNPAAPLQNLVSLNDDNSVEGFSNPYPMFYINGDPNACVTLSLLYFPWAPIPLPAPVGILATGPGTIATSCVVADPEIVPVVPPGPNAANTLAALRDSARATQAMLAGTQARTDALLGYDTDVFGALDWSLSFIGRTDTLSSNTSEGAGALVIAHRLNSRFRIGAFVDVAATADTPVGIDRKSGSPAFGAFAVYEANPDLVGLSARTAVTYAQDRLSITRDNSLFGTEPGSGKADLNGIAAAAELAWGWRVLDGLVVQAVGGLRYSETRREGYTEEASAAVTAPIHYDPFVQRVTSALAALRVSGRTGRFGYFARAGLNVDLSRQQTAFAGSSTIPGLETYSFSAGRKGSAARLDAGVGADFAMTPTSRISAEVGVRQQSYSRALGVTAMLKVSAGF